MEKNIVYNELSKENIDILYSLKNKTIAYLVHDPLQYSKTVTGVVGIAFDEGFVSLECNLEKREFFGDCEEIASFSLIRKKENEQQSWLENVKQIKYAIQKRVNGIRLVFDEIEASGFEAFHFLKAIELQFEDGSNLYLIKGTWFMEEICPLVSTKDESAVPVDEEVWQQGQVKGRVKRKIYEIKEGGLVYPIP